MMKRELFILVMSLLLSGCSGSHEIPSHQAYHIDSTREIYKVEMNDGRVIDFRSYHDGLAHLQDTLVVRTPANGRPQIIPLSEIKTLFIHDADSSMSLPGALLLAISVSAVAFLLAFHGRNLQ